MFGQLPDRARCRPRRGSSGHRRPGSGKRPSPVAPDGPGAGRTVPVVGRRTVRPKGSMAPNRASLFSDRAQIHMRLTSWSAFTFDGMFPPVLARTTEPIRGLGSPCALTGPGTFPVSYAARSASAIRVCSTATRSGASAPHSTGDQGNRSPSTSSPRASRRSADRSPSSKRTCAAARVRR